MQYLLCRNRVIDYIRWRRIFDSHKPQHLAGGLNLIMIWQSLDDKNEVHFLFKIHDLGKAQAFLDAPEHEQIGKDAGVVDGNILYLEELPGY